MPVPNFIEMINGWLLYLAICFFSKQRSNFPQATKSRKLKRWSRFPKGLKMDIVDRDEHNVGYGRRLYKLTEWGRTSSWAGPACFCWWGWSRAPHPGGGSYWARPVPSLAASCWTSHCGNWYTDHSGNIVGTIDYLLNSCGVHNVPGKSTVLLCLH